MNHYYKLTNNKRFIGNNPVTLSKDTYSPKTEYLTTYKLDGKRHLLLIENKCLYFITSKMIFNKIDMKTNTHLNKTLLDGEMFNGHFYAFDILFYKGIDLRKLKLDERLIYLNSIKIKDIYIKEYISGNTCKDFYYLKKKFSKEMKSGIVDGIILTPNSGYSATILKWKPKWLLSIDFKIKKVNGNTFHLLTQKDKIYKNKYTTGIIKVSKKNYDIYPDNSIVEFIFKNKKFTPIRARPDKSKSNYITVIQSNFDQIINPVNVKKLLC